MENKALELFKTPFYVFDIDTLNERIDYLKKLLGDIDLVFAIKANPFIAHEAIKKVARLEICSEGEYDICNSSNIDCECMVISGVYKTPEFIEKLISEGKNCIYTTESYNQFILLEDLSKKYNKTIRIMPRFTSGNQFGVTSDEVIKIIENIKENELLTLVGIEYFSGTQKYSLKKVQREFNEINELLTRIKDELDLKIEELEYGSGFPVEYFNENNFNEVEFISEFKELVRENFKDIKFTMELGRSIASSCGMYYTKIVDLKTNKVGNFAICDGGMNHLVYYGQTMAMKYPELSIVPERNGSELKNYNICGALCTINDIMVKQLPLYDLCVGDALIFKNAGAYSMCEGISLFLSRDLPTIILKKNDEYKIVRDVFKTSSLNTPNLGGKNNGRSN